MSKELRLNLTMVDVQIGKPFYTLAHGSDCWPDHIEISIWSLRKKTLTQYCGKFPQLSVYPEFPVVRIRFVDFMSAYSIGQTSFSVIDAQNIMSVPCNKTDSDTAHKRKISYNPVCLLVFVNGNQLWLKHFPIRAKYSAIILLSVNTSAPEAIWKFHDGPGVKSELLQPSQNRPHYSSSTFQAVLYCRYSSAEASFVYKEHPGKHHIQTIHVKTNHSFTLPSTELCSDRALCVILLETSSGSHVNLTMTDFKYAGDINTHSCAFAGLIIDDKDALTPYCVQNYVGSTHKEDCYYRDSTDSDGIIHWYDKKIRKFTYPTSSDQVTVYSTSNSVYLGFYVHKNYGNLSLALTASATKCRGIPLHMQSSSTQHFGPVHPRDKHFLENKGTPEYMLPWTDQCYVILIEHNPWDGQYAESYFYVKENKSLGQTMKILVVGSLSGRSKITAEDGPLKKGTKCQRGYQKNGSAFASCVCCSYEEVLCENYNHDTFFERTLFGFSHSVDTPTHTFPMRSLKLYLKVQQGYATKISIMVEVLKLKVGPPEIKYLPEILNFTNQNENHIIEPKVIGDNLFLVLSPEPQSNSHSVGTTSKTICFLSCDLLISEQTSSQLTFSFRSPCHFMVLFLVTQPMRNLRDTWTTQHQEHNNQPLPLESGIQTLTENRTPSQKILSSFCLTRSLKF